MRLIASLTLAFFASALLSPPGAHAQTTSGGTWHYRLAGGSSTFGRLEVRPSTSETWGTVCAHGFGSPDATVACRSLNYSQYSAYSSVSWAYRGSALQPVYFDQLACTGTEGNLAQCPRQTVHNCAYTDAVYIHCSVPATPAPPASYAYRLADGGNQYGRLEVRPPSSSAWRAVCDDSFGFSDAVVACRSLGLPTSPVSFRAVYPAEHGSSSTMHTYFDDLDCTGTEPELSRCQHSSSVEECDTDEIVLVGCGVGTIPLLNSTSSAGWEYRLVGASMYGRLEVRPNASAAWGTVCNDYFGTLDTRVACRSLGFTGNTFGYRTVTANERGTSEPIYMDNVMCNGNEATLAQCRRTSSPNCGHSEDIAISCGSTVVPQFESPVGDGWRFRLQGGASSSTGRLEAFSPTTWSWGSVCDDGFDSNDALVACRSLGFTTTTFGYRTIASHELQRIPPGPINMDDLRCNGSEATLSHCARASTHDCSHWEDVLLSCTSTSVPPLAASITDAPTTAWRYRLVGGDRYGRLEVLPPGAASNAWGTVCDDAFNNTDASVACRSLGLSGVSASWRTVSGAFVGSSTQPIYMDDVSCNGTEASLEQCTRDPGHNCAYTEAVYLTCGGSLAATWDYRLVDGPSANEGRLEVRPFSSSMWGTVCDDGFDGIDASVACRSLGLPTSSLIYRSVSPQHRGSDAQPIYMDDLACAGTESSLDQCPRTPHGHNCVHSEDVWLRCGFGDVRVVSEIVLSGSGFEELLQMGNANITRELRAAIAADLSAILDVSPSAVYITRLTAGTNSLDIFFAVETASMYEATSVASRVNSSTMRPAAFVNTQALYARYTTDGQAGGTIRIVSASARIHDMRQPVVFPTAPSGGATSSSGCQESCLATIAFAVTSSVALAITGAVLLYRRYRRKNAEHDNGDGEAQEGEDATSTTMAHSDAPDDQEMAERPPAGVVASVLAPYPGAVYAGPFGAYPYAQHTAPYASGDDVPVGTVVVASPVKTASDAVPHDDVEPAVHPMANPHPFPPPASPTGKCDPLPDVQSFNHYPASPPDETARHQPHPQPPTQPENDDQPGGLYDERD